MTKEATKEFKIGLAEFEALTKEFENSHGWHWDESYRSFIESFKEFVFSDQINQQKRKREYFKLKEQLESMKQEFEPELNADDSVLFKIGCEVYKAVPEFNSCEGCIFDETNDYCKPSWKFYDCADNKIIWIKK